MWDLWCSGLSGDIETGSAMFRNGSPATRALSIAELAHAKHVLGIPYSLEIRLSLVALSFLTLRLFNIQPVLNDLRLRALRLTDWMDDKSLMGIRGLVHGLTSVELGTLAIQSCALRRLRDDSIVFGAPLL